MNEQDVREFAGVLDPKGQNPQEKIESLEIQADHWRLASLREADPEKEQLYKLLEKVAKLKADNIRLENNERPIHEETKSIIDEEAEESDLGRLERFKKWAKENLIGLSAVAGIITTVIKARKVIKQGSKAVNSLAKALANIAKKTRLTNSTYIEFNFTIVNMGSKRY